MSVDGQVNLPMRLECHLMKRRASQVSVPPRSQAQGHWRDFIYSGHLKAQGEYTDVSAHTGTCTHVNTLVCLGVLSGMCLRRHVLVHAVLVQSRVIPASVFLDRLVWTMVECDSWLLGPQPIAGVLAYDCLKLCPQLCQHAPWKGSDT